ncbi:putative endonuclease [Synechococcus sp. PCC 6312]|nr:putative endonuclease [Synechococcus sp. PCC 6312]
MEWKTWPSVEFEQRQSLPPESGIYVLVDAADKVWYVGLSTNLCSRWEGRKHHRHDQLKRTNTRRQYQIYWKKVPTYQLKEKETEYIHQFQPFLNFTKVRNYTRPNLSANEEFTRVLKIITDKATNSPKYRSAVLGYYNQVEINENDQLNEAISIIIIIGYSDCKIIEKSYLKSQKRKGSLFRDSWCVNKSYCHKDKLAINPLKIYSFSLNQVLYEFVAFSSISNWLEINEDKLTLFDICNQPIFALRNPTDLQEALTKQQEVWDLFYAHFKRRRQLADEDYIAYRMSELKPIDQLSGV